MSIATELQNYADGLDDSYDAVNDMGGIIPAHKNMNNLDQAIRTIPQNSGITATTFHWGGSPNYSMYKDSGYTTAATYSDIATAYAGGLVYIADGEDEVTYVVVSDIPDAHTITVTGIGLPGYEGGSASYTYASSTWTKTATEFQTKLTAGTNVQINGTTISATDTTYSAFTGATSSVAGAAGLVPAPTTSDPDKFLKGDGTWGIPADTGGVLMGYVGAAHTVIGGGGSNFYVCTDTTYSTLVTVADVKNALAAGKNVYFKFNDGDYYLKILGQVSASSFQVSFDDNTIATMATSGTDEWDIGGISFPTIPAAQVNSDWSANSGVAQILNKPSLATVATSGLYSDLTGTPSLATVATSGDYDDLLNKPTIPTVNDATLTIQHNGTTVDTFTANASSNVTANIETIYADTITPTTAVATIGTTQIADAAVTSAKVDWSTITATGYAPADCFDVTSGYTLGGRLYKIGNIVFGNIIVHKTSGNFSSSQVAVGMPNAGFVPAAAANIFCSLSTDEWSSTSIGYFYVGSGGMYVKDPNASNSWAKATVIYTV